MQDSSTIKFHPMDLSRFGKNPKGLPIFRIVWADSRVEKACVDGVMVETPLYAGQATGKWIMERWQRAEDFVGMSADAYGRLMASNWAEGIAMEYPIDGEYDIFKVFEAEVDGGIASVLASISQFDRDNVTPAERARRVREAYALAASANDEKKQAVIDAALDRKEITNA